MESLRSGALPLMSYLNRLEANFKAQEPKVLAFMPERNRFERLRRDAQALLACYPRPEMRPPLFGIPIGVKDIFHVKGFMTRAGSRLPPEQLKGKEAVCVTKLKEAGVLVLGKTVTTEFAYFAPGPTRNPYNSDHTPGGSSSGSAAAVAVRLCPLALGSQTIGSITRPASFCGVVGYKPSYDRISRDGVIPVSPSLDHLGFFISDVEGIDLVASLLCRNWQLKASNRRPILGIPEGPYLERASKEGLAFFRVTCKRLAKAGFKIKSIYAMQDFSEICTRHNLIVAAEAAKVHVEWFARFGELYQPKTAELIKRGQLISKKSLIVALSGREKLRSDLTSLMADNDVDLWLSPAATGPAPKGLESTGDPIMNLPWTHSGLPTINLPIGFSQNGLPMGLQLAAGWYADEALVAWANILNQSLKSVS